MMNVYKKFLLKVFILTSPIVLISCLYIYFDPFKTIWNYKSYYPSIVGLDDDYICLETYKNNKVRYNYDSFIFGSSRSKFYEIDSWRKYIHSENCFHFSVSGETILGIYRKFLYLRDNHIKIENSLIVLDPGILASSIERKGHLFLSHPELSDRNWLAFQLGFFKVFLTQDFLYSYFNFLFSKRIDTKIKDLSILDDTPVEYNLKYNEIKLCSFENSIKSNPKIFYNNNKMKIFYTRAYEQQISKPVIAEPQFKMLKEIFEVLKANKTEYKIIISPLYDQIKCNKSDLDVLRKIFGSKNVFDFSGINQITNDYHNYYETSHYRPHIGEYIMNEIYK
jgi:hypothetical protein